MIVVGLVSVIIPTYNRAHLVCEAIDSVLVQTYPRYEIIVVDDGSTDGTGELLKDKYGDRIRYVWQPNRGVSVARNRGFRESRGTYVLFLDSDDLLVPQALAALIRILEKDPSLSAAFGDGQFVGPGGVQLGLVSERHAAGLHPTFADAVLDIPAALQAFLFRREALLRLEGPFDERMWGYEDWDIIMRLCAQGGRLCGTREIVFQYRILGGNKSSPTSPMFERRRQSFIHNRKKMLAMPVFDALDDETRAAFFRRALLGVLIWDVIGQREFLSHPHFSALPASYRARILYDLAVERMAGVSGWLGDWEYLFRAARLCPLNLRLYVMAILDLLPPVLRRNSIRIWRHFRRGPVEIDPVMRVLQSKGVA